MMNMFPPTLQRYRPLRSSRRGICSRVFLLLALAWICLVDGQDNVTTDDSLVEDEMIINDQCECGNENIDIFAV